MAPRKQASTKTATKPPAKRTRKQRETAAQKRERLEAEAMAESEARKAELAKLQKEIEESEAKEPKPSFFKKLLSKIPLKGWHGWIAALLLLAFVVIDKGCNNSNKVVNELNEANKPLLDSNTALRSRLAALVADSISAEAFYQQVKQAADSASAASWQAGQYSRDTEEQGRQERATWKQRTQKLTHDIETGAIDVSNSLNVLFDDRARAKGKRNTESP